MSPLEIGRGYDEIAERWTSEQFPRTNGIAQHERAIAFAKNRGHALDIGCGASGRLIDLMMKHGFEVEAVDISKRMIELAKRRHPGVAFHQADISEWAFPRQYDLVSAWDSIWHLPLAAQEGVMKKILAGLAPGGVYIFSTGGLDEPGEKVDAAMGPKMYYSALGIPKTLEVIAASGCICRHLEYDQYPESHLYLIAQKA